MKRTPPKAYIFTSSQSTANCQRLKTVNFLGAFMMVALLICGCSSSALRELPTPSTLEISVQIQRLKSSCHNDPDNPALQSLYRLQATSEPDSLHVFSAFDQSAWMEFEASQTCWNALATNTIEGSAYLLSQNTGTPYERNSAKLGIARALLWREYSSPKPNSGSLKIANRLIDEYIIDEANAHPSDNTHYMHASYVYIRAANRTRDKNASRMLLKRARELARKGFYLPSDKFHMAITYHAALSKLIDITPKESSDFYPMVDEMIKFLTSINQDEQYYDPVSIGFYQALAGNYQEAINTFARIDNEALQNKACLAILDDRIDDFATKEWISVRILTNKHCSALRSLSQ